MAKSHKSVSKADAVSPRDQEVDGKQPSVAPDLETDAKEALEAAPEMESPNADPGKDIGENSPPADLKTDTSSDVSDSDPVLPKAENTEPVVGSDATNQDADEPAKEIESVELEQEKEDAERDAVASAPVRAAQQEPRRSIFWPLAFGGLVAAGLGFISGRGDLLEPYLPASMQRAQTDLTQIEGSLAEVMNATAAQMSQIEALRTRPDASEQIAGLTEAVTDLEARLAELEARPAAVPSSDATGEGVEALQEAVSEQQATLQAQRAEIAALAEKADAAEATARSEAGNLLARAALTRVVTAVETGDSFSPALDDLEEIAAVDIPEALRTAAETGVPTLAALQDSFPEAARAGLAAARAEIPESEVEGFGGFIRRQLGARSVTPREGSDPDAILSRAEAALRQGDLATTLTEMEALPEVSRTAMQDWLDTATVRQAAEDAANALADSLKSN